MERTRTRNLWIGLGILALLVVFAMPFWGSGMMLGRGFDGYGFRPYGFGGAPFFWGIGLLIRLVIFGGILFFVVSLFRRRSLHLHDDVGGRELSSLEILNRRYAAGEITREQYEDMRRTLEGRPPA
jgi:putative membrane protein